VFVALDPHRVSKPTQHTDEETTIPTIKKIDAVKALVRAGKMRDGWSIGPFSIFLLWLEKQAIVNKHGKKRP
jgi:hypothetical protein